MCPSWSVVGWECAGVFQPPKKTIAALPSPRAGAARVRAQRAPRASPKQVARSSKRALRAPVVSFGLLLIAQPLCSTDVVAARRGTGAPKDDGGVCARIRHRRTRLAVTNLVRQVTANMSSVEWQCQGAEI
ncbi:hypothetical protein N9L68_05405 [bacterium]|nr:hypothetical protein [bacterium]